MLLEITSSCVPAFLQKAGIEALKNDMPDVKRMVHTYKERRDYLVSRLNEMKGVSCTFPEGAFYVFPNIKKLGLSSREFANQLLVSKHVGVCSKSDSGEGYIRLCYVASLENIKTGMDKLETFVDNL